MAEDLSIQRQRSASDAMFVTARPEEMTAEAKELAAEMDAAAYREWDLLDAERAARPATQPPERPAMERQGLLPGDVSRD